jgi:predicted RecB family nuclease
LISIVFQNLRIMEISDSIVMKYIHCPYKAFLAIEEIKEDYNDYSDFIAKYQNRLIVSLNVTPLEINTINQLSEIESTILTLGKYYYIENLILKNYVLNKLIIKIIKDEHECNKIHFVLPNPLDAIYFESKINAAFIIFAAQSNGLNIDDKVTIISTNSSQATIIKLDLYFKKIEAIIENINKFKTQPPFFSKNKHCRFCGYNEYCMKKAIEDDHLSLISSLDQKEIEELNSKGIFSVKQLSYTFKPRRKRKDVKNQKLNHFPDLKALCLRKRTVLIYDRDFNLRDTFPRIYLDVEGYVKTQKYYSISIVIDNNGVNSHKSFWIDNFNNEMNILYDFIRYIEPYISGNYSLYCYGKYDKEFLEQLYSKIKWKRKKELIKTLIENYCDLFQIFHYQIYVPTFSNNLKSIASFLGYKLYDNNFDGITAYINRKEWEDSNNFKVKKKILLHNIDDCYALKHVLEFIINIKNEQETDIKFTSDLSEEIDRRYAGRKLGNQSQILEDYQNINKRAYFDYQRDKIFFGRKAKIKKGNYNGRNFNIKVNKNVELKSLEPCL